MDIIHNIYGKYILDPINGIVYLWNDVYYAIHRVLNVFTINIVFNIHRYYTINKVFTINKFTSHGIYLVYCIIPMDIIHNIYGKYILDPINGMIYIISKVYYMPFIMTPLNKICHVYCIHHTWFIIKPLHGITPQWRNVRLTWFIPYIWQVYERAD